MPLGIGLHVLNERLQQEVVTDIERGTGAKEYH